MTTSNASHTENYAIKELLTIPLEVANLISLLCYVIVSPVISVIGVFTNLINISVYYKHGMKESVNISFMTLALTDLAGLVCCIWYGIGRSSLLVSSADVYISFRDVAYVTGAYPRVLFSKMTCLITVYIALERCFCVVAPLHVKTLITPMRTVVTLSLLYALGVITNFPILYLGALHLSWKKDPTTNKTYLGMVYSADYFDVSTIVTLIKAFMLVTSFIVVATSTVILSVSLQRKSKWRDTSANFLTKGAQRLSKRDATLSKTTILISTALITCYLPYTTNNVLMATIDGFQLYGKYNNFYVVMWSFSWFLESLNSTASIFIYYTMSTKYKETVKRFLRIYIPGFKTQLNRLIVIQRHAYRKDV
uniref:G-protein coupled receptors family 1 profile domain-containing protein n=1 Tax=Biomphalaria glabrata TaxID=6526 RepID=A0A2C9M406_BIOGL